MQKDQSKDWKQWICDRERVVAWMSKYDLPQLIRQGNGLVRIQNFLPALVAEGMLDLLTSLPDPEWCIQESKSAADTPEADHKFMSAQHFNGGEEMMRVFSMLLPSRMYTFSAGKYQRSCHIEPHDDTAKLDIDVEGIEVRHVRDIAVIFYLTKNWRDEYGGVLIDRGKRDSPPHTRYVPEFNSLIAFQVPRWHEVSKMECTRSRYSVFGWFWVEEKTFKENARRTKRERSCQRPSSRNLRRKLQRLAFTPYAWTRRGISRAAMVSRCL